MDAATAALEADISALSKVDSRHRLAEDFRGDGERE